MNSETNSIRRVYTPEQMVSGLGLEVMHSSSARARATAANEALMGGMEISPPPETPEQIARVRSMLEKIPASCDRDYWRQTIWAIAATGWTCAKELAREWSATAADKFEAGAFIKDWDSFDSNRGTGFGTLVHHAEQHGWVDEGSHAEERYTGSGGDVINGRLFASMFRNKVLFIHETGEVLVFNETQGWISAPPGEADRAAKTVLELLRVKAADAYKVASDDPKTKRLMAHVERTIRAPNLRSMIEMAKSEPGMTCRLRKWKKRAHGAFHEAAHCVIACDLDHIITGVTISVRNGSRMRHDNRSLYAQSTYGEGRIALAGVVLEHIMHGSHDIPGIKSNSLSDLKCARGIYLDSDWFTPAFRTVRKRILELWPIVEYATVSILRKTSTDCNFFPGVRWNNKLWGCIWGDAPRSVKQAVPDTAPPKLQSEYRRKAKQRLKAIAPWANKVPPLEFLSGLLTKEAEAC